MNGVVVVQRVAAAEPTDFTDDEMLAAVLEMSRQEAALSAPPPVEDEPTNSPDKGFGDGDAHDLAYHTGPLEAENKQPAGSMTAGLVTAPLL